MPTGTIFSESEINSVPIVATILRTTEVGLHEDASQGKVAPLNKDGDM
jgi:hypothetical protein